jgi:branched-chain amino acid transport system ATP-binding protein
MLRVTNLYAGYGKTDVLHGVSFEVKAGQGVSLIGANGAGKSTTLKCITGLLPARAGSILFEGLALERLPGHQIVRRGITMCPEGRQVFGGMSVLENLKMGALGRFICGLCLSVQKGFSVKTKQHLWVIKNPNLPSVGLLFHAFSASLQSFSL